MLHPRTESNARDDLTSSAALCSSASDILVDMLKTVLRKLHAATRNWRDDDEHVHQLRVSVRRALAAIGFFQDLIPKRYEVWFRKKLKSILHATRLARDLDVLIAEGMSKSGRLQQKPLKKLRSQRKHAQTEITEICEKMDDKSTFQKHRKRLAGKLASDFSKVATERPCVVRAYCLSRLRAFSNPFAEVSCGDFEAADLHRLRIQIKQLRYAAEIVEQMTDRLNLVELLTALTEMQEHLGFLQDHVAAKKQLQKLERHEKENRRKKNLRRLIEAEDVAIAESVDEFRRWLSSDGGKSAIDHIERLILTSESD